MSLRGSVAGWARFLLVPGQVEYQVWLGLVDLDAGLSAAMDEVGKEIVPMRLVRCQYLEETGQVSWVISVVCLSDGAPRFADDY